MPSPSEGSDDRRLDAVVAEIRRLHNERQRGTVTSRIVAENLTISTNQVAPLMDEMAENGQLEKWGSSTPQTYLIRLSDDGQND